MADKTENTNLVIGDVLDPLSACLIRDYEAEATVTKGDPVYLSSDGKITPAEATQPCIGVATMGAAVGVMCAVICRGRVKVKAGGVITRGKAVMGADASKRVIALAGVAPGSTDNLLGWAEQTAAADDLISIMVVK